MNTQSIRLISVDRHLVLHHGGSLSAQYFDRLKHVDNTFVPHPLQDDAQRHEHPRTTNARTTQRQLSIIIIIIFVVVVIQLLKSKCIPVLFMASKCVICQKETFNPSILL